MRIFPAWSHLDREALHSLRRVATEFSASIEICEEIPPRLDWLRIARNNIRHSDYVLLVLTTNSASSTHCEQEVSYAEAIGKTTLIWTPAGAPAPPEWVRRSRWLSTDPIDARQALLNAQAYFSYSLG